MIIACDLKVGSPRHRHAAPGARISDFAKEWSAREREHVAGGGPDPNSAGRFMEMFGKLDPDDPEKIVQDEYQSAAGGVMRSKDLGAFMEDFLGAPEHHYSSVPIIVHGQPVCTLCVTDNKHHEAIDLSKLEAIAAKAAKFGVRSPRFEVVPSTRLRE